MPDRKATEGQKPASDEGPTPITALIRKINELVPGTLTIHFARRDVSFDMQGSDAIRILTAHRRGRPDDLGNDVDPDTSDMLFDWLSVALDKALVVSWSPGPDAIKVVAAGLKPPTGSSPAK